MKTIGKNILNVVLRSMLISRYFCFFLLLFFSGCVAFTAWFDPKPAGVPNFRDMPTEASKTILPDYWIEPPDIISIEALHLVPKDPYVLRVFDIVYLNVLGMLEEEPIIDNTFSIEPGGTIQLGGSYGSVKIDGLSLRKAEERIKDHLMASLGEPVVTMRLVKMSDIEQIAGTHLVGPDGYITLGSYGRVLVSGLTIPECREAIELQLSKALEHPQVAIDIFSYNSKDYFVIFQSVAGGEQVLRFPYTGNEDVLRAIANCNGLTPNASKRIWVARPIGNSHKPIILPVDWVDVTAYAGTHTNYQLLPGDRVFVVEDRWVTTDGVLARIIAPMERVMGFSLLTASVLTRYYGHVMTGGGERGLYNTGTYR
ncbi:MAG: polysaccharide biosynthesis/export family protein [Planctomycetaceae bacterium]|jgi:polysaccharide export outer membrane protein|nr:polysaccharide biosynthesis/export family protein [Planctomycetaceae bacterium]